MYEDSFHVDQGAHTTFGDFGDFVSGEGVGIGGGRHNVAPSTASLDRDSSKGSSTEKKKKKSKKKKDKKRSGSRNSENDHSSGFDDFDDFVQEQASQRSSVGASRGAFSAGWDSSYSSRVSHRSPAGYSNTDLEVPRHHHQHRDDHILQPEQQYDEDDAIDLDQGLDDDSECSDITGLTGVFSKLPHETFASASTGGCGNEDAPRTFFSKQKTDRSTGTTAAATTIDDSVSKRSKSHSGPRKTVSWGRIEMRHYERVLTYNPSTISGPSIGIGWGFALGRTVSVDHVEHSRTRLPRPSSALLMNREIREDLLMELGYSQKDIAAAVRINNKARNQRRQTVQNINAEKVEEALEGAGKGLRKLLKFRKSKHEAY